MMSQSTLSDSEQLRALGYTTQFERTMNFWENFSLGFTYLSPVVGVYSVFAMAIQAGGPAMFWNYILVGLGQLLVCLIFGEVVSQYPISGGIYPWCQRLVGRRWAWMSGWIYSWALFTTIAAVAVGGAPFLSQLLGIELGAFSSVAVAITMILFSTVLNLSGTKLLARVAMLGFICEIVGAIAVGGYLLLFHRNQPIDILWNTFQFGSSGSYWPAFLASSVAAMFCYYGFEACGDVAEETPNAGSAIPKSMRLTIYIGGGAASFVCLALLLALPDLSAAMSGSDKDPVGSTLKAALGEGGFRVVIGIVMISFLSCLISLQAASSRLLFALGRDRVILASHLLSKLHPVRKVPSLALVVSGVVPGAIAALGYFLQDAVNTIISFAAIGIYIAFQMVVLGALYSRLKGNKPNGRFSLGAWGLPINLVALIYGTGAIINMVWPRSPTAPWFINYSMGFMSLAVIGVGLVIMALKAKPTSR